MRRIHPTLSKALPVGSGLVLDFGCGDCPNRALLESRGYKYIGMDNDLRKTNLSVWGDCHRVPFKAETFEIVVSTAVLEHLPEPVTAAREVRRILKPGGVFVGSVAFLEPFHSNSHFHMSGPGLSKVLRDAGLEVERIWAGGNVLESQFRNLFPWRGVNIIAGFSGRILWKAHLFLFWLRDIIKEEKAYSNGDLHRLAFASAIGFIARKKNEQ